MKIFSTLLISSALLSTYTLLAQEQTIGISMTENRKSYDEGYKAYNDKDFQSAYKNFSIYLKNNPSNKRLDFFLGRSAYEIGKYEEALISYTKARMKDPKNVRVILEIAQTYYKLQQYDKAKENFHQVLQEDIPDDVKKNINLTLAQLSKESKTNFFQTTLMIAYAYDSNVNNNARSGAYSIYVPDLNSNISLSNPGDEVSDSSVQVLASLDHTYKLSFNSAIESKATLYSESYFRNHEKDVELISLNTAYATTTKDSKTTLGLIYDHIFIDSKSYLDNYSFIAKYDKRLSKTLTYQGYGLISKKKFADTINKDRDSLSLELFNSLTLATQDYGVNTLAFSLGQEKKDQGSRTDVDKNYYQAQFINRYKISKTLLLDTALVCKQDRYKDTDINFLVKRKDTQKIASIGFLKSINNEISIGTKLLYMDNDSNHSPFKYDKYTAKVFMYYGFDPEKLLRSKDSFLF